jgi:hypothetical protein
MTRLFVAALTAASLMLPTAYAQAGSSHRHKQYRHSSYQHYGHGSGMWRAPVSMRGPRWSGPNRCWQDLGYGRYESCDR